MVDHLTSTSPTSVKVKWLVSVPLHSVEINLPPEICRLSMQLRWLKISYVAIRSDLNAQGVSHAVQQTSSYVDIKLKCQ